MGAVSASAFLLTLIWFICFCVSPVKMSSGQAPLSQSRARLRRAPLSLKGCCWWHAWCPPARNGFRTRPVDVPRRRGSLPVSTAVSFPERASWGPGPAPTSCLQCRFLLRLRSRPPRSDNTPRAAASPRCLKTESRRRAPWPASSPRKEDDYWIARKVRIRPPGPGRCCRPLVVSMCWLWAGVVLIDLHSCSLTTRPSCMHLWIVMHTAPTCIPVFRRVNGGSRGTRLCSPERKQQRKPPGEGDLAASIYRC
jgi:hypothetical protein